MKKQSKSLKRFIILLIFLVIAIAIFLISNISSINAPLPTGMSDVIQNGLEYLESKINPELGLVREAPVVAPNKYWLTNDNSLAAYTFDQFGQTDSRDIIIQSINQYGRPENNFIEVVMGHVVDMPPRVPEAVFITKIGDAEIWTEKHESDSRYEDWQEYANLGFMMALNSANQDNGDLAQEQVLTTMQMFDGKGFRDKAFNGSYETYKLALAIYAANKCKVELQEEAKILEILLVMQDKNGGFHSHYDENLKPLGDTNTETTSFALLAIHTLVYR